MTKLIVVSNRLPVTVTKRDGGYEFIKSSGGLVSALSAAKKDYEFVWFGWPGIDVPMADQLQLATDLKTCYDCIPIYLERQEAELFYNGFSNEVIWPLFHYFPEEIRMGNGQWDAYIKVNQKFAKEIAANCDGSMLFWIHDYQLMLLPKMLRDTFPRAKIGFFLHIPFLSSEIYSVLPVREIILEGILGSDLVGFHTFEYARHFVSSCSRIMGLSTRPDKVAYQGRDVEVAVIPIGIDPEDFLSKLDNQEVLSIEEELVCNFKRKKVVLGVDRLDYIKGIPNKLLAFKQFLLNNPKYVGQVVLLQIAIPSRTNVTEYQNLRSYVNEIAGEVNGSLGTVFNL
jgi:trehalose-6-phosphate synthase